MFIVPVIYEVGTNTSLHFFNRKNLSWQIPPFRGLNGGYRGLMGFATFLIIHLKVTLKCHNKPLKIAKYCEKTLKSNKKGSIRLY